MSLDFAEFRNLRNRYAAAERELDDRLHVFLISEALKALALTKENTPVDTGRLRANWYITDIKKIGDWLEVELYNNVEYASFVEDGTRYIKGKHMARLAIRQIEREIPAALKNMLAVLFTELGEVT